MSISTNEMTQIVYELNVDLHEHFEKKSPDVLNSDLTDILLFSYSTCGFVSNIKFGGIELWNEDSDPSIIEEIQEVRGVDYSTALRMHLISRMHEVKRILNTLEYFQ